MGDNNFAGKYIVGAYATSPNLFSWNENIELKYFNQLKELPFIRGLELPFWGNSLHPFDDNWLLENLDRKWENVFTCIPGTIKNLSDNPSFGLASIDNYSRIEAINFYEKIYSCTKELKKKFGNNSVSGIYISSAPYVNGKVNYANKNNFINSLFELSSWDWGDTKILLEHCDAYTEKNINPKKGFLSLRDEVFSINKINNNCGYKIRIVINWARSVIEYRNINGPLNHIKYLKINNLLGGLMFSGTTSNDNNNYGAWSDIHMPPATYREYKYFESESLMTYNNIKNTLSISNLDSLDFIGIKLLAKPNNSSLKKRIAINRDTLCLLDKAVKELH